MYKINGVFECEQPVYRLQRNGAESLPDEELLALVLRIPQRNGLDVLPKLRSFLRKNPLEKLADFDLDHPPGQIIDRRLKGNDLTKAQQLTLMAAVELSRRVLDRGMGLDKPITSPTDVLSELRHIRDAKKEHFVAIFLNARNCVIKVETISVGSINASIVCMRELFGPAVATSACSLICAHNHPSNCVTPSREDCELTKRIRDAGQLMGIELLDHIIVGSDKFLSMKEAKCF